MSSAPGPRRLPRRVYIVRRVLVLLVLLLVIGLIVLAVRWLWPNGDGSEADDPTPTPTPTQTDAVDPTPGPTEESASPRSVQLDTATEDCDPTLISMRPSVADQEAGGPVTIHLSIATAQENACTLELEPDDVIATIGSDGNKIWDSTPCETALLEEPVTVTPGWVTNVAVEWSGQRSGSNCTGGEEFVNAGDYGIQVATRGGEPGRTGITLTEPPEPEPEDEEDDEGSSDDGDAGDDESDGNDQAPESESD